MDFKTWLKSFDAWENASAKYAEELLRSPNLLKPVGAAMTSFFQLKADVDRSLTAWWSALGLPTRAEQERLLHGLHEIESRLYDLEERIAALRGAQGPTAVAHEGPAATERQEAAAPSTAAVEPAAQAEAVRAEEPPSTAASAKPRGKRAHKPKKKAEPKLVTAEVGPADLFATAPEAAPAPRKRAAKRAKKTDGARP